MVWQSTLTRAGGKAAALVIQTQMTLEGDGDCNPAAAALRFQSVG